MNLFPEKVEWLRDFDGESMSMLASVAGDLVLLVDEQGIVLDTAANSAELGKELEAIDHWTGRRWDHLVTSDSRSKTAALLQQVREPTPPRWVQINYRSKRGLDIPILCAAVQLGSSGRSVVVGRDLRTIAALQQKLVDAQQSMERDYLHLRHVETRYRILFQMSSEAVLVVDPTQYKILEANPASLVLLGAGGKPLTGRIFLDLFDPATRPAVEAQLALVRTVGRAEEGPATALGDGRDLLVSASLFRQDNASLFLVRVAGVGDRAVPGLSPPEAALLQMIDVAPDGFVLTGPDGRILATNAAFRDMAQIAGDDQALGSPLEQWLGRPGVDMSVMIASLRQRGTVSLFATTLRGQYGDPTEVEISAAAVNSNGQACYGFVIRNVGRRIPADVRAGRDQPRSVDQLTELIGRVPLKDLVREATDMIERLCIQAALELTGDNRASAAELLGLSRQSLYVKLRRHGLGDLVGDDDEDN